MNVQFRICTETDLPSVQNHVLSLHSKDSLKMRTAPPNIQSTFQEFSMKPEKGQIIVFDVNHTVIGYAILVFFWSNEYGGNFIDIDELFVQEDHRNCGIGSLFFQWLEAIWQERAVAFSLQATLKNDGAIAFYRRIGFSESPSVHFIKTME